MFIERVVKEESFIECLIGCFERVGGKGFHEFSKSLVWFEHGM